MSASVFPARAGMSPFPMSPVGLHKSVPRASGDEPGAILEIETPNPCSPRERG